MVRLSSERKSMLTKKSRRQLLSVTKAKSTTTYLSLSKSCIISIAAQKALMVWYKAWVWILQWLTTISLGRTCKLHLRTQRSLVEAKDLLELPKRCLMERLERSCLETSLVYHRPSKIEHRSLKDGLLIIQQMTHRWRLAIIQANSDQVPKISVFPAMM